MADPRRSGGPSPSSPPPTDRYGALAEGQESDATPYAYQHNMAGSQDEEEDDKHSPDPLLSPVGSSEEQFVDEDDLDDEEELEGMSIQELLYSSSSYYAIAKPVTLTMILSALAVVLVNTDATREAGEQAMSQAYQVWHVDSSSSSNGENLAFSLANAFIMISVIGLMTFVIVFLYKMRFMKCLIGYMIFCSSSLLGVLGGNLLQTAIHIYSIPVDKFSFAVFMFNFAVVGVLAVFFGQGIPVAVTQGYLIATSVILAWQLNYFDPWTTWALLFMLALYDLCAVLTPCGPLKALVNAMSEDDAPEMPGLLFEAELPPEAKRPSAGTPRSTPRNGNAPAPAVSSNASGIAEGRATPDPASKPPAQQGPLSDIPLAIVKVYNLPIVGIPEESKAIMYPQRHQAAAPLLQDDPVDEAHVVIPENPTPAQLRALVTARMPAIGGKLERAKKGGRRVYMERDREGNPKRILWVDRSGKVFAEMRDDADDEAGGDERNSIRLGLGDFIFYSVLVAKAAQYSFATFAACTLVILAGLGGTLILLAVYHHALPALPISILLGIVVYLLVRIFVEPWIEFILYQPYYV